MLTEMRYHGLVAWERFDKPKWYARENELLERLGYKSTDCEVRE